MTMSRMIRHFLSSAVASTLAFSTGAWARGGETSRLLSLAATDPQIVKCYRPWDKSCFRITVKVSASGDGEVDIGHLPDNMFGDPYAARAIVSSGASCVERRGVGLPMVGIYSDNSLFWREPGRTVSASRSAFLILDFGCDGQIVAGDELQVQLPLGVDATGRGISKVDFSTATVRLRN